MRRADVGRQAVLGERAGDAAGAIIGIGRVGEVLELALEPTAVGTGAAGNVAL